MENISSSFLVSLADKYEVPSFIEGDPSWFMHHVEGRANREVMAFVASCLSYGSRKQFLPKIDFMRQRSGGDISSWVSSGAFEADVPPIDDCYYRLYTFRTVNALLRGLRDMLREFGSVGDFVAAAVERWRREGGGGTDVMAALEALSSFFRRRGLKGIVAAPRSSVCKRPVMLMRWMVRTGSPVDLGLWADILDRRHLLIPLDTHVVQVARSFGLIATKTTSWATAVNLTARLADAFPDDPARGDFALYGLGIDK